MDDIQGDANQHKPTRHVDTCTAACDDCGNTEIVKYHIFVEERYLCVRCAVKWKILKNQNDPRLIEKMINLADPDIDLSDAEDIIIR